MASYEELAQAELANQIPEPGMGPPPGPLRLTVRPAGFAAPTNDLAQGQPWGAPDADTGRPGRLFEPDQTPYQPPEVMQPIEFGGFRPSFIGAGKAIGSGLGSLVQGARDMFAAPAPAAVQPQASRDPTAGPRQMWQQGYPGTQPTEPGMIGGIVGQALQQPHQMILAGKDVNAPGATDEQVKLAREQEAAGGFETGANLIGWNAPFSAARKGATAGVFGGRLSRGFDPNKEKLAATMEVNGVTPQQIWRDTGMVKFADGKWAHEIPDIAASYKGDLDSVASRIFNRKFPDRAGQYGSSTNVLRSQMAREDALLKIQGKQQLYLPDVIDHPELFKAYPELRNMPVSHDAFMQANGGYMPAHGGKPGSIVYREDDPSSKMARGNTFKTLIHEIQHSIQQIEGMARGTNPNAPILPGMPAYKIFEKQSAQGPGVLSFDEYKKIYAQKGVEKTDVDYLKYRAGAEKSRAEFDQQAQRYAGRKNYEFSAGENVANLAMDRADLTEAQLRGIYPPGMFKTPMNKQLVEFNRQTGPGQAQIGSVLNPMPREMQASSRPSGLMPPKSERKAQGSLNPLDEMDVTWKGKPMAEWKPQDWKEVGDHYGVKNLGPLSPVEKYVSPDGYHFEIPGGTKGTWTYYDLLHMKANPINPHQLPHELHAEMQKKLGRTMTPHGEVGHDQIWNGLMFGMTSASNPLFPNQLSASRLRLRDPKMLDALADSISWKAGDDVSKELRGAKDLEIGQMFNLHEGKSAGSTGLGTRGGVNYTYIAELAQMFRKNPEWFRKKSGEEWIDFVERLATQTKGLSMKTGSFGSVWQDPYMAAISAVDRHMAKEFERRGGLFLNAAEQDKWQAKTLAKWNKDKKLTGDQQIGSWNELTQQRGFEGFMGEELLSYVGAHSKKEFRNTAGEINPSLPKHVQEARTFYEPEKGLEASAAYKRALAVNQKAANEQGLNLFMSQWFEWDRIRQRFEPHENMFPGLSRMPAPSKRQLEIPMAAHLETGHRTYDYGPTGRMNPTKKFPRNPSELGYLGVLGTAGGAAGIGSLVDPKRYNQDAR